MKHKNTKPSYIFNKENTKNSEPLNGPRRGLNFIALPECVAGVAPTTFPPTTATLVSVKVDGPVIVKESKSSLN